MKKSRKLSWTAATCAAILLLFLVSLTPLYRNYIREDHDDSCRTARWLVSEFYHGYLEMEETSVSEMLDMDPEERLAYIIRSRYGSDYSDGCAGGICREGGTWTIKVDPESKCLRITCDAPGHGEYIDKYDADIVLP